MVNVDTTYDSHTVNSCTYLFWWNFLRWGRERAKEGRRERQERGIGEEGRKKGGEEGREGENFLEHLSSFFFPHLFPFHPLLSPLSSLFSLSFFSPSFFIWRWFSCSPGWPRSLYVAGDYLELIFLFSSPGCWNERHAPPCLDYLVLGVKFGDLWMLSKHSTNLVLSAVSTLIFLMLRPTTMSEYHNSYKWFFSGFPNRCAILSHLTFSGAK